MSQWTDVATSDETHSREDADMPVELNAALRASALGDVEGTIGLLNIARQAHPKSAWPDFLLAAELAQAGRVPESEMAYARALLLAPHFGIARFQLGLLQFTTGREALALLTWQPLMSADQSDPLRQFALAFSAWAQGQAVVAETAFRAGLQANRVWPPLNGDMALALTRLIEQAGDSIALPTVHDAAETAEADHVLLSNYRSLD